MRISIKEPCPANWDNMKIKLNARHCKECSKNVIDFTQMSRSEIITYLLEQPKGSVCGRMNQSQFDFKHEDIPHLVKELKSRPNQTAFLILTLVCLSLSSCKEDNQIQVKPIQNPVTKEITTGKIIPSDTIQKIDPSKLEVLKIKETKKSKKEPDYIVDPELMGEVCVTQEQMLGIIEDVPFGGNDSEPTEVLRFADVMPEYKGGVEAMFKFIENNMRYPEFEKENNIQGTVYVSLIINDEGKIESHKIIKSVSGAPNFNQEVDRILSLMPNWIPGSNKGKNVSVEYTLPIRFILK
jgi:TonB family protein